MLEKGANRWALQTVDAEAELSWSRGRHAFRDVRLADALEDVNRYTRVPVSLGDPSLGELTVSGNFIAGDSRMLTEALVAAMPLRAVDLDTEIVLFPRYRDFRPPDGYRAP